MFSRSLKFVVLAALTMAVTADSAEAFGRRQSTSCYTPIYYPCPCPQPQPQPVYTFGTDYIVNNQPVNGLALKVYVTSVYGDFSTTLQPGQSVGFKYITSINGVARPATAVISVTAYDVATGAKYAHADLAFMNQSASPPPLQALTITNPPARAAITAPPTTVYWSHL